MYSVYPMHILSPILGDRSMLM